MSHPNERQELEEVMLAHLKERGSDWATAKELAVEVGYPWRVVARTLIRLANSELIEQEHYEWRSSRQRTRRCWKYRPVQAPIASRSAFPAWLMPRQPDATQKRARAMAPRVTPQIKRVRMK